MFPVVLQEWLESERGWGKRPDGYSVHLSMEDCKAYIKEDSTEERKRNPSGDVPNCYSRSCGNPTVRDVEKHVIDKLLELKAKKQPGFRIWSITEIETKSEKKLRDKVAQERLDAIETRREEREKLKAQALSKLTDEDKDVLGLNKLKPSTNDGWRTF